MVALGVPGDEATDLVAASWRVSGADSPWASIVATTYGSRSVAVVPLVDGRWAACNVFIDTLCVTQPEAERRLARLLKAGTRGTVGCGCEARVSGAYETCNDYPLTLTLSREGRGNETAW
ncbi:hypothetical protein JZU57_01555, partial [bacterium]|nr:hypothetical protein [bacterium]